MISLFKKEKLILNFILYDFLINFQEKTKICVGNNQTI